MHLSLRLLFLLLVGTLSGAFAQPSPSAVINQQTSDVHNLLTQYEADYGSLSRFYIVDGSPERRERFQKLNTDYLSQLQQLNFDRMTTDSRVDYLLFRRDLQENTQKLAQEATERNQIKAWFPFADSVYAIEKLRRRGHKLNVQAFAGMLNGLGLS